MEESEQLQAARAMRRAMLGDEYVDAMAADTDPVAAQFQDYITSMAWGVWARGGSLSTRDRSLLVMAMTAALGRMEEFRLHVERDAADRGDGRRGRRTAVPDRRLLWGAGRDRGRAVRFG